MSCSVAGAFEVRRRNRSLARRCEAAREQGTDGRSVEWREHLAQLPARHPWEGEMSATDRLLLRALGDLLMGISCPDGCP